MNATASASSNSRPEFSYNYTSNDAGRFAAVLPELEKKTTRKVERSIAFMRENIHRPLQIATLAAMARVSASHFFALFKQQTGCAPMDYFTRLRMRHACQLLATTPASVKEVAAALGYDDPFYFSRVFKAVNNVPPSRYRNSVEKTDAVAKENYFTPQTNPARNKSQLSTRKILNGAGK